MPEPTSTPQDWDKVRTAFASSLMVETALSSLAQSLDGPDWPIKGPGETPAKYIDLPFEEVCRLLDHQGQPPDCIDQLVAILRETLAFDNPFGEMVAQVEASTEKDNQLLKNLTRLEIPEKFPLEFMALAPDVREFCALEKISTIGEFAVFAQSLSQNVIVGGDFRALLNALANIDEQVLAQHLPFRPGTKGLHLPEALAQSIRGLPHAVQAALATKAGARLGPADAAAAATARKDQVQTAEAELQQRTERLTTEWFQADFAQVQQLLARGTPLARSLVVLSDPGIELIVADLLRSCAKKGTPPATAPTEPPRKRGFFARWFGRK
jgi:hypothetical protein